jgi:excisionase family DNA binding protein
MSYEAIDPLRLPSIALERRATLLPVPAVYFLIAGDSEVIYVGQAGNLRSRWTANHHCLEGYPAIAGLRIAWIEIEDETMRTQAERSLIARYRPLLNRIYKPHLLLPPAPAELSPAPTSDRYEDEEDEPVLTTRQTAERLRLSTARIIAMIRAGRLPATRFGSVYAIRERDLALVADRKPGRPKKK